MNTPPEGPPGGPLTTDELAELEGSLLPALERHHLRLLAHGLRTLQGIAGRHAGPAPDGAAIAAWVAEQAPIAGDQAFQASFSARLRQLADQLASIAGTRGVQPLDLSLGDLRAWAKAQADQRLEIIPGD